MVCLLFVVKGRRAEEANRCSYLYRVQFKDTASMLLILYVPTIWIILHSYPTRFCAQNVKAVFDAAIKVVLQPPKQKKKKKRKAQKGCSIL